MNATPVAPERKRRLLLQPEPVFTVSLAGVEAQRRFILFQRLFFTLAVVSGLGAMWGIFFIPVDAAFFMPWVFSAMVMTCLVLMVVARHRHRGNIQALFFWLGWIWLGALLGSVVGHNDRMALADVTVVLGLALVGGLFNTAVTRRRESSSFRDFLLTGPWLLIGCMVAFIFFPAGEWGLCLAGCAAVVLLFCIHQASSVSLERFTPMESLVAAADIIPITVLVTWWRISGEA